MAKARTNKERLTDSVCNQLRRNTRIVELKAMPEKQQKAIIESLYYSPVLIRIAMSFLKHGEL